MTRIRYFKNDHLIQTVRPILCNNRFVSVTLDTETMRYKLVDVVSKEVLVNGVGVDANTMKRNAKRDLRSIGATFSDEVRKERKLIIGSENS